MRPQETYSPAQCRAARGLLRWTAERLAENAALETEAVELFEAGDGELSAAEVRRIGAAFYVAGLIAIPENHAGEGVRFKSATRRTRLLPHGVADDDL